MSVRHPSSPNKPYIPWQWKLRIRLEELRKIPDADIRTKGEIEELERRLRIKTR